MVISLGELAVRFGCELRGDPDTPVERVATLGSADARSISFLAEARYTRQLAQTQAAAVVLDRDSADACRTAALICENPRATFARIVGLLHPAPARVQGLHPSALIAPSARIDATAFVGALAVIGERVEIGPRAVVGPHCVIEEDVKLAEEARLVARVTLCHGVVIGARTLIHPGAVVGADGFGFAPERGKWLKVPQVGSVRVGADVEIGANTTIDRGAIDDTVIEEGVKLDNQIQIGHNVRIGAHTAVAGCTGISGSTVIGKRCMIGGAVAITGHITIADDVVITGFSMVSGSVPRAGVYSSGIPLEETHVWRRLVARFKRIDLLAKRVNALERAADPTQGEDDD
jgi:UDP-3-O-[3-hydroxymyristoyl] glucosamine N-acyltransferase